MLEEYLELVRLSKLYLLQDLPQRHKPAKKPDVGLPKLPTLTQAPPQVILPKPFPELKKQLAQKKIEQAVPPPPVFVNRDLADILGLIKTHCPLLKIIETPAIKKIDGLLLVESEELHPVLINLKGALNKLGYRIETLFISSLEKSHIEKCNSPILIGERSIFAKSALIKEEARKDDQNQVWIGNAKAKVISSCDLLYQNPDSRRIFWVEILSLLKD